MTPPRSRSLIARCFVNLADTEPRFDLGAFAERILLFDRYVLESVQLREMPTIIGVLGYDGTKSLVESGGLHIYADAVTVGETNGASGRYPGNVNALATIRVRDVKSITSGWLTRIVSTPDLKAKQALKLRSLIGTRLSHAPYGAGIDALDSSRVDILSRSRTLQVALAHALSEVTGQSIAAECVEATATEVDQHAFALTTNLSQLLGLPAETVREVERRAVLGIAALNQRLEWMRHFNALPALRRRDVEVFESKLAGVGGEVFADAEHPRRLARILDLVNLPDVASAAEAGSLRWDRLLEARESDEARAFRDWLSRSDTLSDQELRELVGALSARLPSAANTNKGRLLRIAFSSLAPLAFDPSPTGAAIGFGLGVGLSVIDQFIWDKVLRERGPWSFVDERIRPLFGSPFT